jgi:ATP-dependent HslUV protease subunit HslV
MIGDGQVTMGGSMVLKANARKVRTLSDGKVLVGFAGATADAFTLVEMLESRLEGKPGQLMRACVELAKQWRTDRFLRHLQAELIAADRDVTLMVTGSGDVIEPTHDVAGTGSGATFAVAAARALIDIPGLSAEDVARKSMNIAADMCIFTNTNFIVHSVDNARHTRQLQDAAAAAAAGNALTQPEKPKEESKPANGTATDATSPAGKKD